MANIPFLNNAYFAGKVGIGTDSPEVKLDVRGQLLVAGDTPVSRIGSTLEVYRNGTTAELSIHQDSSTFSSSLFSQLRFRNGGNDTYLKIPQSGNGLIIDVESQANAFVIGTTGNVGIGTTSPSHRLTVVGGTNGRVARLGNLEFTTQAATYTGSSIEVTGSNSFIKYNSTLGHKFFTRVSGGGNTLEALTIAPDTGNVGIGKTSPLAKLHTRSGSSGVGSVDAGTSAIIESNTTNYLRFLSTDSSKAGLVWTTPGDNFAAYLRYGYSDQLLEISTANSNDGISFSTGNASEKMRILSSGNVGIGTTSPSAKLEIAGAGNQKLLINRTDGDNFFIDAQNGQIRMRGSDPIYMGVSGDLLAITNTNVGIGTTGPLAKLHLSESAPGGNPSFILQDNARSGAAALNYILLTDSLNTNQAKIGYLSGLNTDLTLQNLVGNTSLISSNQIKITAGTNTLFENSGSEKMRITSSGNVGIGTTSPGNKLTISGPSSNQFEIINSANSKSWRPNVNGTSFYITESGVSNPFVIQAGGNVGIGTTAPNSKLDVSGDISINGALFAKNTSDYTMLYKAQSNSVGLYIGGTDPNNYYDNGGHFFRSSGGSSTYMSINSAGNVGIGTTNPSRQLELKGQGVIRLNAISSGSPGLDFNTSDVNDMQIRYRSTTDALAIYSYGTSSDVLTIKKSDGNVGIGTTGPSQKLHVTGNARVTGAYYDSNNSPGTSGQILSSTVTGTDWVSGSGLPGGPYLPLAGGTMSGNTNHSDNVKDRYGTGNDFQIWHDGSNTFLSNEGEGHLNIINTGDDRDIIFKTDDGSGATTSYMVIDGSAEQTRFYKDTRHTDGVVANFGNSNDLQIYHDGSNSYIKDTGSGGLRIASDLFRVYKADLSGLMINAVPDDRVELYFNNNKKLETTSTGVTVTGAATATTFLGDLNGTINTATTAVTKANATNDTTVATTAFVQNLIGTIPAGLVFQGTWNAATNTPTLTSGSGTTGHFYIVSTDGSTNLDGITDWKVGDWAVFVEQGASDQWEKVDNSSVLDGSGTGQKVTRWGGSGTSNTLTDGPITFSGNNSTFAGNVTGTNATFTAGTVASGIPLTLGSSTQTGYTLQQFKTSAHSSTNAYLIAYGAGHGSEAGNFAMKNIVSSGEIFFELASGVEPLRMTSTGSTFAGDISIADKLIHSGDTNTYLSFSGADNIKLVANGKNVLHAHDNGNLYLYGNNGTALTLDSSQNATFAGDVTIPQYLKHATDADTYFGFSSSNQVLFHVGGGDRLIINSAGRVGIGTTNPASILHVNGGTGALSTGLTFGDGDTGIWEASDDNLRFSTVSSTRMIITSAGNVGIGNTSPTSKLFITAADGEMVDTYMVNILNQELTAGDNFGLQIRAGLNTSDVSLNVANKDGSSLFRVRGDGNVGIGTTNPSKKLEVNGTFKATGDASIDGTGNLSIRNRSATGSGIMFIDNVWQGGIEHISGNLYFRAGGQVDRMTIKTSGNVGIGTTSPSQKLHINNSTASSASYAKFSNAQTGITTADGFDVGVNTGIEAVIWQRENSNLLLATNNSERMRITSSGNVGIGTTSPVYKLDVNGGASAGGVITYSKSSGSLDTTGYAVAGLTTGYNGNSTGFTFTCFGNTGGYQKIVYSCYNGAGTWYSKKVIDEGTNDFDVEASANGSTITFTFKSTSGTKNYTPRVTIEATGHSINSTYA